MDETATDATAPQERITKLMQKQNDNGYARGQMAKGQAVECYLCLSAFRRIRMTFRFCAKCGHAFCEGEHGTFSLKFGCCVVCWKPRAG